MKNYHFKRSSKKTLLSVMMVSALYAGYPQDAFATANEVQAVMQSDPVKEQVVDENGSPVIGATVMMKGTSLQIRADKIVPYKVQVGKKVCTIQKCTVGWEVRLPVSEITEEVTIWWK